MAMLLSICRAVRLANPESITTSQNFFRASGDVINSFERVRHNVHSLLPFLQQPPLSRPGAWAYPDGMELGRMSGPYRDAEDRTIFGCKALRHCWHLGCILPTAPAI